MSLHKDLIFLILQFCDEQNLKKTARMLEQETGYIFRLAYFEELVLNGNWEEVENYVSSFTKIEDNIYSARMYLEMRKQKFIEALDRHDYRGGAHNILRNEQFTSHGDTLTARKKMMHELRILIHANPLLQGRTVFPQIDKSRLQFLINQIVLSIELDKDEKHLLAVQETQLAICETITLQCLKQWDVANFSTRISHPTFSCDAQLVYAAMTNGTLIILGASNLIPTSQINPFAYLPCHPRYVGYVGSPILIIT